MTIDQLIHDLASLLQVKLDSEFDRNFEREGFFSEKWQRTRYGSNGHHTLIQSGALRRSIRSRLSGNEIEFVSDLPYSVIHNEGGRAGRGHRSLIPRRRFMGDHPQLVAELTATLQKWLDKKANEL